MRMQVGVVVMMLGLLGQGCVSAKKHDALKKERDQVSSDLAAQKQTVEQLNAKIEEQKRWISELETKLGRTTTDRAQLETNLTETRKALEEAKQRRLESEKRIAEYSDLVRRFQNLVDAGRLSVKIVDGRMVVALSSDVLFTSGSARLSNDGRIAIHQVAELLISIPNRKYQIEGHTDNVPIKTQAFPSNWELASARALNVVREMVDAGMPAERVSAASFAETKPARPNDTPEGQAANRRIEIVIVPDLSSLPGFEQLQKMSGENKPAG